MTVYIAGPMTGYANYNFDKFNEEAKRLRMRGYRILNPASVGDIPELGGNSEKYWPINKAMIDGADAIYMLLGWEKSDGARREFQYAAESGLAIWYEVL